MLKHRLRVCRHCGELHDVRAVPDNCRDAPVMRSHLPSPYVISDSLPGGVNGLFHHGALQKFDSKSQYRRATQLLGMTEVGNEQPKPRSYVESTDDHVLEGQINDALNEVAIEDGQPGFSVSEQQNVGKGVWNHGSG